MDPPHHAASAAATDDDPLFDTLNSLEATHFAAGHAEGFAHGALHGTFEGRALGQEKAFELWEELGYMEGVARSWLEVMQAMQHKEQGQGTPLLATIKPPSARSRANAESLLGLIASFPTRNPSSTSSSSSSSDGIESTKANEEEGNEGPDLALLLERSRAKFRLLCAGLGVKARLMAAPTARSSSAPSAQEEEDSFLGAEAAPGQTSSGPSEGVMRF